MADYRDQNRGAGSDYDRYLAGMDASMQQKVALTAAHLLCEGRLADMGMGSGSGSFALASLYPALQVIGVDIDPEMVRRASERYQRPNLRFVEGDIGKRCFADGEVDAILDSSVLHHVTSYGGYDRDAAARAMAVQSEQLAPGGVLVVRDFLDPGPGEVLLDLRDDDGRGAGDDVATCSTAQLFERFAREFRRLLPEAERGFAYARVTEGVPEGWARFRCQHRHAVEMVLRKDYRDSWDVEVQEEYTYATQAEMVAVLRRLGMRILASTPIHNPWIERHRFSEKIALWSLDGERLDDPATNYVVVAQKVAAGEGVLLEEATAIPAIDYVVLESYRRDDGAIVDLARRPGQTLDVIPWFEQDGALFVLARRGYPRPILAHRDPGSPLVGGAEPVTYVSEPLVVMQSDKPMGQTVEEMLVDEVGLDARELLGFAAGAAYFPSPGAVQEQVRSVFVEGAPTHVRVPLQNLSGFRSSGVVRAMEAGQILRAAQVGGLPDARLELNVYELMRRRGRDPGAWIGEAIALAEPKESVTSMTVAELRAAPRRRRFRPSAEGAGFLRVQAAEFFELDAQGNVLSRQEREMVLPKTSLNTVAVAVLRRDEAGVPLMALEDDDRPASQCHDGHSEILTTPAWRLPSTLSTRRGLRDFVRERLRGEHGVEVGEIWSLGGRYHPAPGLTPEVVHPVAVEACSVSTGGAESSLSWVPLVDLCEARDLLVDGHTRIVALRAAHALGLLGG